MRWESVFRCEWLKRHRLAALAAGACVLAVIQFSTPNLIGNDAYFHIRYASVIWQAGLRGFPPPFPWLPLTILAPDRFADHHTLYHVLLIPFTWVDLRLGAKLAGLACGATMLACFLWFLSRGRACLPQVWLLFLFASSADFLFRLCMTRVQSLSIAVLIVALDLACRGRALQLGLLALGYTWLYDGFPLLIFIVLAVAACGAVAERRIKVGPVAACFAGIAAGLILNPYFPHYLLFIYHHFGDKLLDREPLRIGREWFPYSPIGMVANMTACTVFLAVGLTRLQEEPARRTTRTLAAAVIALVFFGLALRSRRFIEYYAPFATLFFATTSLDFPDRPIPLLGRRLLFCIIAIVAAANIGGVLSALERKKADPYDRYRQVAQYVADNAPAGAMLCSTDWDDFPWLYFYNTRSSYLVGLDPTYLRDRNPELYWLWVDISSGSVAEPSELLATRFRCAYMMTDRLHTGFLRVAALDPGLEQVLATEHAVLYRVIAPKEHPAGEEQPAG